MKPQTLGDLWSIALRNRDLFSKVSKEIIEAVDRDRIVPGGHAVDVGANVGRHRVPFAEIVGTKGRVTAFEPVPSLAAGLKQTIQSRHMSSTIELRQLAVSNVTGRSAFHEVAGAPALSAWQVRNDLAGQLQATTKETDVVPLGDIISAPIHLPLAPKPLLD
jgi:FkbM family methyltransferase